MLTPINPNTGKNNQSVEKTDPKTIAEMTRTSRLAQNEWSQISFAEKKELFNKIADEFKSQAETIAKLIQDDMGKPFESAKGEVLAYAGGISGYFDTMEEALKPTKLKSKNALTHVHYVPHGVCAIITPWNFPFGMPWTLLVPALLGGNTVLFKPSEIALHTGIAIFKVLEKHLPQNVIQLIVGDGAQGSAMVSGEIDFVGFVGSQGVGKSIRKETTDRMARLLLELGGKDPMIVGKDADLEKATSYAVNGSLRNTGQVCVSVERILVDKTIETEFIAKSVELTSKVEVAAEKTEELNLGPMSSQKQMDHVLKQLKSAEAAGAKIHIGGKRIDRPGFFLEPTVISNVDQSMEIMTDETFGPVVCIQGVDNLDEAVRIANDTRYGLAATLWMKDESEAAKIALKIESGLIGINRSFGGNADTPWTGAKESGFGHSGGVSGMRTFLQPRSITTNP